MSSEGNMSRRQFLLSSLAGLGAMAAPAAVSAIAGVQAGVDEFASHDEAIREAWRLVEEEGVSRVIVKGDAILSVERGRGVGPLIRLLASSPDLLKGATIVDSVAGRAVAAVAAKGGAVKVLARTASEGAKEVLAANGIPLEAKVLVGHIMNRDLTGTCPIEVATEGLENPQEIIVAARRKLDELRQSAKGVTA